MAIATRLGTYLSEHNVPYQVIPHFHSNSSIGTAITANVPLHQIAKAVLLKDHEDRKIMAVLPANHKISLSALNDNLHASYHLLKEQEVYQLFTDCENGAIPPFGEAYNMTMVCEQQLAQLDNIYVEAGDHETLLSLNKQSFEKLMSSSMQIHFSHQVFH